MVRSYDDRWLHSVTVGHFDLRNTGEETLAVAIVTINLTSADGTKLGPGIDVQLGIPATPTSSLVELRDQALQAAHSLIQRVAREDLSDLQSSLNKAPLFEFSGS